MIHERLCRWALADFTTAKLATALPPTSSEDRWWDYAVMTQEAFIPYRPYRPTIGMRRREFLEEFPLREDCSICVDTNEFTVMPVNEGHARDVRAGIPVRTVQIQPGIRDNTFRFTGKAVRVARAKYDTENRSQ